MNTQLLLDYSDTYAPAAVLLLCAFLGIGPWSRNAWVLLLYVSTAFVVFGFSNLLADRKINNLFLYHFFILFEVVVTGWFVLLHLSSEKKKQLIVLLSFLFCVYSTINSISNEQIHLFNKQAYAVGFLLSCFYCLLFYFDLVDSEQLIDVNKSFSFWAVTGFFIYASVSTLVFYFYSVLSGRTGFENLLWSIQDIALLVKYCLISIGLICQKQASILK